MRMVKLFIEKLAQGLGFGAGLFISITLIFYVDNMLSEEPKAVSVDEHYGELNLKQLERIKIETVEARLHEDFIVISGILSNPFDKSITGVDLNARVLKDGIVIDLCNLYFEDAVSVAESGTTQYVIYCSTRWNDLKQEDIEVIVRARSARFQVEQELEYEVL